LSEVIVYDILLLIHICLHQSIMHQQSSGSIEPKCSICPKL